MWGGYDKCSLRCQAFRGAGADRSSTGDESLAEQTLGGLERPSRWGTLRRSRPMAGHCAFAHRGRALGAEIFIKLAGGEDEQQFFADRLGDPAFRTIEFGGNELRHTV